MSYVALSRPGRPRPVAHARQHRRIATLALAALLPNTALAWLLTLLSARGAASGRASLGDVAWWAFWVSATAGVTALLLPSRTRWAHAARICLITAQIALELTVAMAILAMS